MWQFQRGSGGSGSQQRSPTQANVIFYLGERRRQFAAEFGRFGAVLEAVLR